MNPFLNACGATGPLQLSIECQGAARAESVAFELPFVLIGRDPGSDLHFPHRDVSERHVYLQMVAGHLCYMDLGSRNGTYLGGKCLRSGWLLRQTTIRVGPYRIRLVGGDAGEWKSPSGVLNGAPAPPPDDAPLPQLTLELSHRGIRPTLSQIHGELTLVGSSADCDVRVLDPSVSNYHCSLMNTLEGVWVIDLLGQGGVTVNGRDVRYGRVEDGDELRVGHSLIRLRRGSSMGLNPLRAGDRIDRPSGPAEPARPDDWPESSPRPPMPPPALGTPTVTASEGEVGTMLAEQPELIETFLAPFADKFELMQQQMLDQFQQAGLRMFQTFSALHEEQVDALRRELEQLRRLNQELDTIRGDLATRATPTNGRLIGNGFLTIPMPSSSPRLGSATTAPSRTTALALAQSELTTEDNPRGAFPSSSPSRSPNPPTSSLIDADPQPEGPSPLVLVNSTNTIQDQAEPPTVSQTVATSRLEPLPSPERPQDEDVHAWLCQRANMIEGEQQSRWQRILSLIPVPMLGVPLANGPKPAPMKV